MTENWNRAHLGRIVWWRPCIRLRREDWRGHRRQWAADKVRWGDQATWRVWLKWHRTYLKSALKMREKSMAVTERRLRLDAERDYFLETGGALMLHPGRWEDGPWLGYAGMHYTTTNYRGEPLWANDMGLV